MMVVHHREHGVVIFCRFNYKTRYFFSFSIIFFNFIPWGALACPKFRRRRGGGGWRAWFLPCWGFYCSRRPLPAADTPSRAARETIRATAPRSARCMRPPRSQPLVRACPGGLPEPSRFAIGSTSRATTTTPRRCTARSVEPPSSSTGYSAELSLLSRPQASPLRERIVWNDSPRLEHDVATDLQLDQNLLYGHCPRARQGGLDTWALASFPHSPKLSRESVSSSDAQGRLHQLQGIIPQSFGN